MLAALALLAPQATQAQTATQGMCTPLQIAIIIRSTKNCAKCKLPTINTILAKCKSGDGVAPVAGGTFCNRPQPSCAADNELANGTCTPCPAGKADADKDSKTAGCGVGTYAGAGAMSCATCPAGFFDTDSDARTPCLEGQCTRPSGTAAAGYDFTLLAFCRKRSNRDERVC